MLSVAALNGEGLAEGFVRKKVRRWSGKVEITFGREEYVSWCLTFLLVIKRKRIICILVYFSTVL